MLDFRKLMLQIAQVGRDDVVNLLSPLDAQLNAQEALDKALSDEKAFKERLENNRAWTLWPVAVPLEPLTERYFHAAGRTPLTVVGVDGSQIMPSHHEVHNCFLLNIGSAVITYGAKHAALLDSEPRLYHKPEDLYPLVDRRRMHIDELYVSLERMQLELESQVGLCMEAVKKGLPVIALVDGSLIPWSLEKMPDAYQDAYLKRMSEHFDNLRSLSVPLIGYLSHSRSSDLVNDLRVSICPYEVSHCRDKCGHLNEEDFPCSTIWPLTDRQLLTGRLSHGERTAAFLSGASVARSMPSALRIAFAYLNVGNEIARIEFPRWLLSERAVLNLSIEAILAQVEKGAGYPVCLAEAHHLAVIRGADRKQFFDLVAQQLVAKGLPSVRQSPKEKRKRISLI